MSLASRPVASFLVALVIALTAGAAEAQTITLNYDLNTGNLQHRPGVAEDSYTSGPIAFSPVTLSTIGDSVRLEIFFFDAATGARQDLELRAFGTGSPNPETFASRNPGDCVNGLPPCSHTFGPGMIASNSSAPLGDAFTTMKVNVDLRSRVGDYAPDFVNPYVVGPVLCGPGPDSECRTGAHFPDLNDTGFSSFHGIVVDLEFSTTVLPFAPVTIDRFEFRMLAGELAILQTRQFTVDTTVDSVDAFPGDGRCADSAGRCSLRAAAMESNANRNVVGDDSVHVPAGHYTLTMGRVDFVDDVSLIGDGSDVTIIDGNNASGVLRFGTTLFEKTVNRGRDSSGTLIPAAVATDPFAPGAGSNFVNCLASEGCLGKPGLVDVGGSNPITPIRYDFSLSAAEVQAVTGSPGRGLLTVVAARDLGRKAGSLTSDVLPAQLDGSGIGDLFRDTIDTCPPGENFDPINFFCGPNFHNDFPGTASRFISESTFQDAARDGSMEVLLTPVGGAGNAGTGRLKIFSVQLQYVTDLLVTLRGLTVQDGRFGGGIRIDGAFVQTSDLVVKDSSAFSAGGGILNNIGTLVLRQGSIRDNSAGTVGGGIANTTLGILRIDRSTLSGNTATQGAGMLNSGDLELTNSTVSGNTAELGGGGLQNTGLADIAFTTITANAANDRGESLNAQAVGGGIRNALGGRVFIGDSIVAGNTDNRLSGLGLFSPDCYSIIDFNFTSFRDNLVGVLNANCDMRDSTFGSSIPFDTVGSESAPLDALLQPLANNGGRTETHALMAGSPAIDRDTSGTSASFFDCPNVDQRDFLRPGDSPSDTTCDVGSYEFGAASVQPVDTTSGGQPVTVTFTGVTQGGVTSLSTSPTGPAPPVNFKLGNPPTYYDVTTTTVADSVMVCVDFTGVSYDDVSDLALFHFEDTDNDGVADTWVDRTTSVDLATNMVCATVDSLSLFGLFERFNHRPVADAGPDQLVECEAPNGASVLLDGSGSSDLDGDPLVFEWVNDADGSVVGATESVAVTLPLGIHTFTLTVDDGNGEGGVAIDQVVVTVEDTTPPTIDSLSASPDVLWPPNHQMVPISLQVVVSDLCDPAASCAITSITSSEPVNGAGDGNTAPDWEITGDLTANLRAERAGHGSGRTYSIVVTCTDASGNSAERTVSVLVPKSGG